jgi:hypothetical protein
MVATETDHSSLITNVDGMNNTRKQGNYLMNKQSTEDCRAPEGEQLIPLFLQGSFLLVLQHHQFSMHHCSVNTEASVSEGLVKLGNG